VYSEVEGLSVLLGFKTANAGCCKVRAGAGVGLRGGSRRMPAGAGTRRCGGRHPPLGVSLPCGTKHTGLSVQQPFAAAPDYAAPLSPLGTGGPAPRVGLLGLPGNTVCQGPSGGLDSSNSGSGTAAEGGMSVITHGAGQATGVWRVGAAAGVADALAAPLRQGQAATPRDQPPPAAGLCMYNMYWLVAACNGLRTHPGFYMQ